MNAKLARSSNARQPLTGSTLANVASLQHNEVCALPLQMTPWGNRACIKTACCTVTDVKVRFWLILV